MIKIGGLHKLQNIAGDLLRCLLPICRIDAIQAATRFWAHRTISPPYLKACKVQIDLYPFFKLPCKSSCRKQKKDDCRTPKPTKHVSYQNQIYTFVNLAQER